MKVVCHYHYCIIFVIILGLIPHSNHAAAAVMIVNPTTPNAVTGNMSQPFNVRFHAHNVIIITEFSYSDKIILELCSYNTYFGR